MHHRRLVLEDADAAAQKQLVVHATGLAHQGDVGEFAGNNDPNVDAAAHRPLQRARGVAIGNEVRVADVNRFRGADDRHDVEQLDRRASLRRRRLDDLGEVRTAPLDRRKVVETGEQLAATLHPVVHERKLHLRHDGAFDPRNCLAPVVLRVGVTEPIVGNSHSAGEADLAVDNQHLPVRAMVEA